MSTQMQDLSVHLHPDAPNSPRVRLRTSLVGSWSIPAKMMVGYDGIQSAEEVGRHRPKVVAELTRSSWWR